MIFSNLSKIFYGREKYVLSTLRRGIPIFRIAIKTYLSRIYDREVMKNCIRDTERSNFDSCNICPRFAPAANLALVRNRCFSPLVT